MFSKFNTYKKILNFGIISLLYVNISGCQTTFIKQENNTDIYHGMEVVDNYKHLENLEDESVLNWLKKQTKITENKLKQINGFDRLINIQESFSSTDKNEITSLEITSGNRLFYLKRRADERDPKLYVRDSITDIETLIFDPKAEGTASSYISAFKSSWDGSMLAVSITENGKEFSEIRIINVNTKKLLPEVLEKALPTYGGMYWLPDNSGILYPQVPIAKNTKEAYLNMEMILYKLDSKESRIILSKKNNSELDIKPEDIPIVFNFDFDKKYLYAAISGATLYQDYYYSLAGDLKENSLNWKSLFKKEDQVNLFYRKHDSIFYLTSKDASNFKLCGKSLKNPDITKTIIKEKDDEVISSFRLIKKGIVYVTTKNGIASKLFLLDKNGKTEELALPFPVGKILLRTKGQQKNYLSIIVEGWLNKNEKYLYNFSKRQFELHNIEDQISNSVIKDFTVEEANIPAHDGVTVPVSLIYNKNTKKNGDNPVFMVAYGAYGISIKPTFSKKILAWVKEGGIFAIAHVRGGREKGDAWYKGGLKETKPNTWKDLISSAEYLIKNNFTSANKIVINGASAGGIAIGRAITERPDLFKAAILNVGLLNTVRGELGYNGENNIKEYGTVKDSIGFLSLLEMDAFHHIKKGVNYPATLITTGINDSRVPSWHSVKFAAKLMDFNNSDNPVFLKVDFNSGHGLQDGTKRKIEEDALALHFAFWQTGHPDYQPKQ